MASIISKAQQQQSPSFSEAEKKDGHEVSEAQSSITRHVYLKSSASAALERDVVLRRIRHHKNLSKLKSAFQALMGSSEQATSAANMASVHETWLHQDDFFSSP